MDASSTPGKTRSPKVKVDSGALASHMECLETRLSFLEKRDKEKNKDIMELKDENLSLHQEVLTLKRTKSDNYEEETRWKKYKRDMTGKLRKEFEKVDTMLKVFNRMIVNGHNNDLEEKINVLTSTVDGLRSEMIKFEQMDFERKLHDLSATIDRLRSEIMKFEQMDLKTKMKDLSSTTDKLHREFMKFEKMDLEKKIKDLSRTTGGLDCEQMDMEVKIKNLSSTTDKLCRDVMRLVGVERKIPELEKCFDILENDILKLQRPSVEEKIISYLRDKVMEGTDMQIIVKLGKKKLMLDVKPTLTILELKSVLEHKTGIPLSKQILEFCETRMIIDGQTLKDYGIKDESVVNLIMKTDMQIVVTLGTLKFDLDVKPTVNIRELKSILENKTGIPVSKQVLKFGEIKLTDDDRTLKDYEIEDKSVINLLKTDIQIILTFGKKKWTLDINSTLTITEFKSVLENKTGIPPSKQVLNFGQTKLTMNNGQTLKDFGIKDESVISLMKTDIHLNVTFRKQNWTLDVKPTLTITEFKSVLENKIGIPPSKQVLIFGRTELTMNNGQTLKDYGIKDDSVISLMKTGLRLVVNSERVKWTLDVKPSLTIGELKSDLENKSGIPASKLILKFDRRELENDYKTLAYYKIQDESVINLVEIDIVNITVNLPNDGMSRECFNVGQSWLIEEMSRECFNVGQSWPIGESKSKINVNVRQSWTIGEFKSEIEGRTKINKSKQVFYFKETKLSDETKTLGDYGIRDKSVVDLKKTKSSSWQIEVVSLFSNKRVILDVDVKTSVEEVISKVHYKIQVPMDEHVALLFNDDRLDQSKLLVECGIRHDSVLNLMTKSKSKRTLKEKGTPNEKEITILINNAISSLRHDERLIPLKVYPSTSINHVKCLLHLKTEIIPRLQTLQFSGNDLDNDQTLIGYNISEMTTIDLHESADQRKKIGVLVHKSTDDKISLREMLDLSNTVLDLKCVIEDKLRLDIKSQELILNGVSDFDDLFEMYIGRQKINPGVMLVDTDCFGNLMSHDRVRACIGINIRCLEFLLI